MTTTPTPDLATIASLHERVAAVAAALTSILEHLGPVAAAQWELEREVERLAELDPEGNAVEYFTRLDAWMNATGIQYNRELLRAIGAVEDANDRDQPVYEAGR